MSYFTEDHDPYTFRHLEALGIARGASCLDVGAGGGSVARWLADRVGPDGRVVAVDIDGVALRSGPAVRGVDVHILDVEHEALPPGPYDLVHSRLMLCNMIDRDRVLDGLVRAARPGGRVVLSDLDFTTHRPAFIAPGWPRVWDAFLAGLVQAGWDVAFGRRLAATLERQGLGHVRAETLSRYVRGGSLTCRITGEALKRAAHVLEGIRDEDLTAVLRQLQDPRRAFVAPEFTIAWGHRAT